MNVRLLLFLALGLSSCTAPPAAKPLDTMKIEAEVVSISPSDPKAQPRLLVSSPHDCLVVLRILTPDGRHPEYPAGSPLHLAIVKEAIDGDLLRGRRYRFLLDLYKDDWGDLLASGLRAG